MADREKLDVHGRLMGLLQRTPYISCADTDRQYAVNWLMNNGVTVRERGRWIQNGELDEDGNGQYHCSVCSAGETHNPIVDVPYCWKCGADMRGEEDG